MSVIPASAREIIAQYFDEQSNWRAQKAEEYPEDQRNCRASAGLEELAAYVRALPDDDGCLQELSSLGIREGLFWPYAGESAEHAISRFRFHNGVEDDDCGRFLSELVCMFTEDALRFAKSHDLDLN